MDQQVNEALRLLFAHDSFLLEADVAERSIAEKLARYLAPQFPNHHVDVEYNRHGVDPKRITLPAGFRGGISKLFVPDIVVHQRGHDDKNLLAIQLKKETNRDPRAYDQAIIDAMKHEYRYGRGLLIDLPAGPGAKDRKARLEWR